MCYNKYIIKICSSGDGWKEELQSDGVLEKSGTVYRFGYSIDGDKCSLTVSGKKVVQTRSGSQDMTLEFSEGENTFCTLGSGELIGKIELFTERVAFTVNDNMCSLELIYFLGQERIRLVFTANR